MPGRRWHAARRGAQAASVAVASALRREQHRRVSPPTSRNAGIAGDVVKELGDA